MNRIIYIVLVSLLVSSCGTSSKEWYCKIIEEKELPKLLADDNSDHYSYYRFGNMAFSYPSSMKNDVVTDTNSFFKLVSDSSLILVSKEKLNYNLEMVADKDIDINITNDEELFEYLYSNNNDITCDIKSIISPVQGEKGVFRWKKENVSIIQYGNIKEELGAIFYVFMDDEQYLFSIKGISEEQHLHLISSINYIKS